MKKSFRVLLIVALALSIGLFMIVTSIPACKDISQIHYMTYHYVSPNNWAEYDNGISTGQFSGALSQPQTWTYNSFSVNGLCKSGN